MAISSMAANKERVTRQSSFCRRPVVVVSLEPCTVCSNGPSAVFFNYQLHVLPATTDRRIPQAPTTSSRHQQYKLQIGSPVLPYL